jgi:serine/threonine-protein kinase
VSNKTKVWKKASEIYAEISELSPQQALAHVYGIENITVDVREAIITLINAGSQASQYYVDNISQGFNFGFNNAQNYSVGQQLDEYELLEEIGHGGMSQVFKAKRINSEQQTQVAIKIFAPKNNSNELLNHFLNEQKILAELSHPNIVKMLHSGKTDDNITYLVMELIEDAQPLDLFCEQNKLSTNKKIKYITQCAQALSYSHANLIIHRDLKPDNILINKDKELKIVDFGIAKLINNDLLGNKTTIMALTPSYAAPEQINSGSISIKTDIFSLAVVALDLLTKENPLPKDRLIKSCANDEHHIDALLKSLKIDKDLKNILNKALEQEPDKRYSSMQSFADDLNNYLTSNPVNATAQSFFYRIQKFAKRRSALFATMVSFLAFMIIGSIVGYKQYQQIKIEAQKANQVKQFMLDAYAQTNPDYAKGSVVTAEDILNSTSNKLSTSQLDNAVKFELLQTIGIAYGQIGQPQKAVDFLGKSLEIEPNNSTSIAYQAQYLSNSENWQALNKILNNTEIETIESNIDKSILYRVLAKTQAKESKFEQAIASLNKAIALNINNLNSKEKLLSQRLMAEFLYLQSKPKQGIKLLENLLKEPKLDKTSSLGMGIRSDLNTLYTDIGELKKAQEGWEILTKQQRQILGDTHPELAKSLMQYSGVSRYQGNINLALKQVQEALAINIKAFGEDSINTAVSLNSLAVIKYQTGDFPKAIEYMYRAVKIFENKQSKDYADTLELKTNLAALLLASKRYVEAEKIARDVYNIQVEKLGKTHDSTIYSQQTLAKSLVFLNQLDEALFLAQEALDNAKKYLTETNPLTSGAYFTLATIFTKQNENAKALKTYKILLDNKYIAENSPNYPRLLEALAKVYMKIGNNKQANMHYIKSIEFLENIYGSDHKKTVKVKQDYSDFLNSIK